MNTSVPQRILSLQLVGVVALALIVTACGGSSGTKRDSSTATSTTASTSAEPANPGTECDETAARTFAEREIDGERVESIECADLTGDARVDYGMTLRPREGAGGVNMYAIVIGRPNSGAKPGLHIEVRSSAQRATDLAIRDGAMLITVPGFTASDSSCCPSSQSLRRYMWTGSGFEDKLVATAPCAGSPGGDWECEAFDSGDDGESPPVRRPSAPPAATARNLTATSDMKGAIRAAFITSHNMADGEVTGPLAGKTYYGSFRGKEWAVATFSTAGTGTTDQPEVFNRRPGGTWVDRGDTGGAVCDKVPRPMLHVWRLESSCT